MQLQSLFTSLGDSHPPLSPLRVPASRSGGLCVSCLPSSSSSPMIARGEGGGKGGSGAIRCGSLNRSRGQSGAEGARLMGPEGEGGGMVVTPVGGVFSLREVCLWRPIRVRLCHLALSARSFCGRLWLPLCPMALSPDAYPDDIVSVDYFSLPIMSPFQTLREFK